MLSTKLGCRNAPLATKKYKLPVLVNTVSGILHYTRQWRCEINHNKFRFGCDIKQFCSNVCLEDYKKGLKVCSYCQKDISGGEGFLAPIGDKGQFKDFCEQKCLQKYEFMHFGKYIY